MVCSDFHLLGNIFLRVKGESPQNFKFLIECETHKREIFIYFIHSLYYFLIVLVMKTTKPTYK